MSGMFESWMHKLVSAVMQRESEANVVVVDWISMAQQLYPDAVNHTHVVGQDIAAMLNWLQVCTRKQIRASAKPDASFTLDQGVKMRNQVTGVLHLVTFVPCSKVMDGDMCPLSCVACHQSSRGTENQ